ncbi:MAG: SPOR domain-containing protein [Betaproteobacteria bacterium]
MRTVVIFLLLANLTFFTYTRLDETSEGEAVRLVEQVQPEKIKLLTSQQVAALGPAKVAALADVCLEWGPLTDADRARALADLEPLSLGKLLSQRRIETSMAFWVYLPGAPNRTEADRRAAELRARGIGEVSVVDAGPQRNMVSLGSFHTEDAAQARLSDIVKLGVANAKSGPRQQVISNTVLVIRDPQAQIVAKLRDLMSAYPGTEAKVGGCDKA